MKAARLGALISALVLAALVAVLVVSDGESDIGARSPLLGQPAPAVNTTTIDDQTFDLARRKGSWVVLNFFNSTCVPSLPSTQPSSSLRAVSRHEQMVSSCTRWSMTMQTPPCVTFLLQTVVTGRSYEMPTVRLRWHSVSPRCPKPGSSIRMASCECESLVNLLAEYLNHK